MKGVSSGVINIQRDFLDFEVKYKSTQNIFDEVYKLTKIVKSSRMDDINERTYKLAEMFVEMSEKYLNTKIKIMEIDNDYSLLDDYVKQVVLTMMEQNKTLLTDIELDLKVLLSLLVEKRIVPQTKINKILKKEERDSNSILFVSEYETVYQSRDFDYLLTRFARKYAWKIITLIIMMIVVSAMPLLFEKVYNLGVLEQQSNNMFEVGPSDSVISLIEPLFKIIRTVTGLLAMLMFNLFLIQFLADFLYIMFPKSRHLLEKIVCEKLEISEDDILLPVQIEKFKLVRAKEIISSIRGIPEYCNAPIIVHLDARLKNKTTEEVLTIDENYAILLVETLYGVINTYYHTNKELIEYSLGLKVDIVEKKHLLLKVMVLKQRLGLN